jgi:hypothetical protein
MASSRAPLVVTWLCNSGGHQSTSRLWYAATSTALLSDQTAAHQVLVLPTHCRCCIAQKYVDVRCRVLVQGAGPSARYAHTLSLVANRFLVAMGGNDGKSTLGDAWALDTSEKPYQWRKITDAGEMPCPRWVWPPHGNRDQVGICGIGRAPASQQEAASTNQELQTTCHQD